MLSVQSIFLKQKQVTFAARRSTSFDPHPSRLVLVLVLRAGPYLATGRRRTGLLGG